MKAARIIVIQLIFITLALTKGVYAQVSPESTPSQSGQVVALAPFGASTYMALDWTERHDPNAALQAHEFTLLGDAIDLQSGRLSFEQVDVSIPGNFPLPVEIRRRMNPSQMQAGEFADWQLAIPTISTMILDDEWYAGNRWAKTRCNVTNLASAIPNASWPTHIQGGAALAPAKWNSGVILVPRTTYCAM